MKSPRRSSRRSKAWGASTPAPWWRRRAPRRPRPSSGGPRRAAPRAGHPSQAQGKSAATPDGEVRYTAPSVVFAGRLEAGGFQPVEAYDVVIANLDRTLTRRPPPADPLEALAAFPDGLTTAEVAVIVAAPLQAPDLTATEQVLIGHAHRIPAGSDALWYAADGRLRRRANQVTVT